MAKNYKSTEKEKLRDEPRWKKQRRLSLWKMYQAGRITKDIYNERMKILEQSDSWYPLEK